MNQIIIPRGLSTVANNLINKISKVAGWCVTHETPKRIATNIYIQDIEKLDLGPLEKAALISNAKKIIREYTNQNDIVEIAISNLKQTASAEKISEDWLAQFMDKARLVNDEQFKLIWGKILSEECNEQGSIPKVLLHILEKMDKNDAEAFMLLCSLSVCCRSGEVIEYVPIIVASKMDAYYKKKGISYSSLVDLQALGLVEMSFGLMDHAYSFDSDKSGSQIIISYFEEQFDFPEDINYVSVGNVIYTKAGQALCKAVERVKCEGFWEEQCIPTCQYSIKDHKKKNEKSSNNKNILELVNKL